jgi:RNA polymerase sigma-70 factor (TIGR02960 family)
MRLALVGALQRLPPRQRAVLILRDVLEWRAAEVAALLDMTTAAVNSALQRARSQVPLSQDNLVEPVEPQQRSLLDRYVAAFETADVEGLVAVLTEDARWEMPPIATWFAGRETILAFLDKQMRAIGPCSLVSTSANGQPAFAVYARGADAIYQPHALHVLTVTDEGVTRIVAFQGAGLFPLFGL